MEEVLLGVAAPGAEMFGGEGVKFWELLDATPFGEVELLEGFHDPDVDWEGGGESVREKEDAIGDFAAYARAA